MDINRTTVPGTGVLHHLHSRSGEYFAVLVESGHTRRLFAYGDGSDEPVAEISLERDEADEVAELLGSRSVHDRLAELERRLDQLTGKRVDR